MATRKEVIEKAIATEDIFTAEEIEVLEKIKKSLERKGTGKPNKTTIENIAVKNAILELIADGRARTAKEIADEVGYTTAKVAGLLRIIVTDNKATKVPGEKTKDAPKYVGNEGAEPYEAPKTEEAE